LTIFLVSILYRLFKDGVADVLSVLLVAIPMGRLGDHYGRRNILIIALVGVAGSLSWIFIVCMSTFRISFLVRRY
jgi:MFS family permease